MNSHEVMSQAKEYMFKTGAVLSATLAASLGGIGIGESVAFADTVRPTIYCPDNSPDPSADPCNGQEDGTTITITDMDPNKVGATTRIDYSYPNGDTESKLKAPYAVFDTYNNANGTSTCNVIPTDGSTIVSCDAYMNTTPNPDGNVGNGGGTDSTADRIKQEQLCVDEAAALHNQKAGTQVYYNFSIPYGINKKGTITSRFPTITQVDKAQCGAFNIAVNATEIIKVSKHKNGSHGKAITKKLPILTSRNNNGKLHKLKFAHGKLPKGQYVYSDIVGSASMIDVQTGAKLTSKKGAHYVSRPNKIS